MSDPKTDSIEKARHLALQDMSDDREARLKRYSKYCAKGMTAQQIMEAEGLSSGGVWYNLNLFGLRPKVSPRARIVSKVVTNKHGGTKHVRYIPQGHAVLLVKGDKYLHMTGQSLTDCLAYAWRGTFEQSEKMIKASAVSGLQRIQEVKI